MSKIIEKERIKKEQKEKDEMIRQMKILEAKRKEEERIRNGTKGKGEGKNYEMFCMKCFVEYEFKEIDKCNHCKSDLITRDVSYLLIMYLNYFRKGTLIYMLK
jgi:hypothetical protein